MGELMSEHLDLQNAHLEQMKTSVQFKNKLGGRCLSSNVDKYSRMLFEDCDASDGSTMWTNRGNNSYVATKSAAPLCPRVGAHVNCGRYSQNLGACAAGGSVCENWYGSCTELGLKVFKVSKGLLLQTLGAKKHCLSIFTKGGEIDKGYKNLVVSTRGTTHFCGVWGSTWEMVSTSEAIAAATAATAAAAAKAEAKQLQQQQQQKPRLQLMWGVTVCDAHLRPHLRVMPAKLSARSYRRRMIGS